MIEAIVVYAFICGVAFGVLLDWLEEWLRDKID